MNSCSSSISETPKITILLSSGERVDWALDDSFLTTHNLSVKSCDEATVAQLKQCIATKWPDFKTNSPSPDPGRLRLIFLGKILEDTQTLENVGLGSSSPQTVSSVIHVSVRPESFQLDTKKTPTNSYSVQAGGAVDDAQSDSRCACCIVM
ncbi:hypothetical protein B0I72DRAFT_23169 [Yarrowia lipolytica]|jgi:hypothetical protein|uniref:Ubiquitin-like domain-containing protein n=1 Tax=Yarrowia lipolytica TaxID=4952 RepID=A0A1H6PY93_YARLL|nr:hypothetical protein YALI1_C12755g [Yarrowia lipolytica]KAB8280775.1 hypothetical protein BKA91DRAFT_40654 [Yarrowia lipolytica]KAE8169848.1 hypothetical protein BKA90DRAFT_43730 [Yarrowia lipolytica]KAJ8053247.1 hypothetical protein LXG23DRAFT_54844 [Yarrowia lipolytica]QNP97361.1 Hypothetical protein YALI2_C01014g [Yarrowia lipolytica]